MGNLSVWSDTSELPHFKRLEHDISTEVLIIGGGICGILCACMLEKKGVEYVLVEADRICGGVTKNTTAKITIQHGFIYQKLLRRFGEEKAKAYLEANEKALEEYYKMCGDIECGFEIQDSFVYSINDNAKIKKEYEALKSIGFDVSYENNIILPINVAGAIKFKNQAQFNPLMFISSLVNGMNIYEHTKVNELVGTTAVTGHGRITAKKIIVATHFPFINKHGSYFIKMYQHRTYNLALTDTPEITGMYVDESKKGMSFRKYRDMLLIGGGGHRTGKKGGGYEELEKFAKKYFKNAEIKYRWATQDCMTLDEVPYIGYYSASTEDLYVATGFNKWGMTSSMVAAMILSDMVTGIKNPYEEVFSPSRTIVRPQLIANAFEAVTNILVPSAKRCPHLGCVLRWNEAEHTWDCPCHGSRFTEDGKLIDNPANDDLNM